ARGRRGARPSAGPTRPGAGRINGRPTQRRSAGERWSATPSDQRRERTEAEEERRAADSALPTGAHRARGGRRRRRRRRARLSADHRLAFADAGLALHRARLRLGAVLGARPLATRRGGGEAEIGAALVVLVARLAGLGFARIGAALLPRLRLGELVAFEEELFERRDLREQVRAADAS